jgi:hypothetical protein
MTIAKARVRVCIDHAHLVSSLVPVSPVREAKTQDPGNPRARKKTSHSPLKKGEIMLFFTNK